MNEKKKKFLRVDAAMEGERAVLASIGKKIEVSEMELICLVNFAEIGLLSLFSELEGKPGENSAAALAEHLEAIRTKFGNHGQNGLDRLSNGAAALLRGEKFFKYMA